MYSDFLNRPLAINEAAFENIQGLVARDHDTINEHNLAIIPVYGALTKRANMFDAFFDITSYEEIQENVANALEDDSIKEIFLEFDSPGGEVNGLFELCDFLCEANKIKPLYAVVNDSCYSAAYALASCCSKIYLSRTGGVGSIGVICNHVDVSANDEKEGFKITPIFAGAKKNDLSPHAPLSEGAKGDLQREVNRLYEMFVQLVSKNRILTKEAVKATEAGTFFGEDAIAVGLADGIWNLKEVILEKKLMDEKKEVETQAEAVVVEPEKDELADYKAEILEISKLCKISKSDRLAEFIVNGLNVEQVKEALLKDATKTSAEIVGVRGGQSNAAENPLIDCAKKMCK